jgi:hypothetical protein
MRQELPYNPLDRKNLGRSVAEALLKQPVNRLPPTEAFLGAGIYAIYYVGDFPPYAIISERNWDDKFEAPIYVGKAVPKGARKGRTGTGAPTGAALYKRLAEHSESIKAATNLQVEDFFCRYLVAEDIWIPLGESLLVEQFSPLWNKIIDGFGNHAPGKGRYEQERSSWDVLHPGRSWAMKCSESRKSETTLLNSIQRHLSALL